MCNMIIQKYGNGPTVDKIRQAWYAMDTNRSGYITRQEFTTKARYEVERILSQPNYGQPAYGAQPYGQPGYPPHQAYPPQQPIAPAMPARTNTYMPTLARPPTIYDQLGPVSNPPPTVPLTAPVAMPLSPAPFGPGNSSPERDCQILHDAVHGAGTNERAIIDIETLKKTNADIIETLDSVIEIHKNGRIQRQQAEEELKEIEKELKKKMLEINVEK